METPSLPNDIWIRSVPASIHVLPHHSPVIPSFSLWGEGKGEGVIKGPTPHESSLTPDSFHVNEYRFASSPREDS